MIKLLWRLLCMVVRPVRFLEVRLANGPFAVDGRATFFVVARGYGTVGLAPHTVDVGGTFSGLIVVAAHGCRARIEARGLPWRRRYECDVVVVDVPPPPASPHPALPTVAVPHPPAIALPVIHVHLEVP
jgi:hypothetical protein